MQDYVISLVRRDLSGFVRSLVRRMPFTFEKHK